MKFDDYLKQSLDEVPIPEQLLPENIAIMLNVKTQTDRSRPRISMNTRQQKKAPPIRFMAAIAAVLALALGITAIFGGLQNRLPTDEKDGIGSGDIREAKDYSDIYKTIQDSLINNGTVLKEDYVGDNAPVIFPVERPGTSEIAPSKAETLPQIAGEYKIPPSAVNGADTFASDGTNVYYIANGSLFAVGLTDGKLTVLSKNVHDSSSTAGATSQYTGLFIDQNRLIAIGTMSMEVQFYAAVGTSDTSATSPKAESTTTAASDASISNSDTVSTSSTSEVTSSTATAETAVSSAVNPAGTAVQTTTFVDIYDITDKTTAPLIYSYKQSGSPLYTQMLDGALYIATRYSGYQTKPLESREDLDNYVPAYYLGEEKHHIDAKDISLSAKSAGASYTVVAGLNPQNAAPLTSIKAFLGGGRFVCTGAGGLYTVGNDATTTDGSFVVRFALKNGSVSYGTSGVVAGLAQDSSYINAVDDSLRMVTISTDKTGLQTANVFILDLNLKIIGHLNAIPISKPSSVRFDGNLCYIYGTDASVTTVDLTDKTAPKLAKDSAQGAYLQRFGASRLLSLGEEKSADGKTVGLKLSLLDEAKTELFSLSLAGTLSGTKRLYLDAERGIIGVPTTTSGEYGLKNLYYLVAVTKTGLVQNGVLEYNDIDPTFEFNGAIIVGDAFYALSDGRIVAARLDDFKVIDTLPIK